MLQTNTQKNASVTVNNITLVSTHKQGNGKYTPFTLKCYQNWLKTNAGGNTANVTVQITKAVNLNATPILPYGFAGGKGKHHTAYGGTRQLGINMFIYGVNANGKPAVKGNGNRNLNAILKALAGLKVSNAKWFIPFLLNGGQQPSNNGSWGVSAIKLVATQQK